MEEVRRDGIRKAIADAIEHTSHCDALVVDCDIDVIDRAQMPGAPGARPGGLHVVDFFWAVRELAGHHRTRIIDHTERDPSHDANDLSALVAARWLAECIAGFESR
jgi:arginase family enzyme